MATYTNVYLPSKKKSKASAPMVDPMIAQLNALRDRMNASLSQFSEQGKTDISNRYGALAGQGQADLVSRGLGGTTILPGMKMGVEREKSGALNRLADLTLERQMGYDTQITSQIVSALQASRQAAMQQKQLSLQEQQQFWNQKYASDPNNTQSGYYRSPVQQWQEMTMKKFKQQGGFRANSFGGGVF